MAKQTRAGKLMDRLLQDVQRREGTPETASDEKQSVLDHRRQRAAPEAKEQERSLEMRAFRRVSPAICRMWEGHNRRYDLLDEVACQDLIEGFRSQGQQIPALVREIHDDGAVVYEVISGARRHWTATFLNQPLLIEIRQLTDEQAFLLADAENRQRKDISDYERAVDYARAITAYYRSITHMAEAMQVQKAWLSNYLALAKLPEAVLAAYRTVTDIKVHHATKLRPLLEDKKASGRLLKRAKELSEGEGMDGPKVLAALIAAAKPPKNRGGYLIDEAYALPDGKPLFRLTKTARGGFRIDFERDAEGSREEIEEAFGRALQDHFRLDV